MSVEVGKYGRIVLPKKVRQKYGVQEGVRLLITESDGYLCLVPVKTYEKPTEALYGSISIDMPLDEPKQVAREHIRRKLLDDLQ
jgi:AbrB family looped-hinge helix DNA binding protein